LVSAAFLASSSLYASPAVSPACNAWPKMAIKDANPSGVLVSIANSSQVINNHLPQPFLIVVTSSRPRTPSTSPSHCNPQPPLCPSFPSTILEQCQEWIQIHSPFHSRPPERFHYTFKGFRSLRISAIQGLRCNLHRNLWYVISCKGVWVLKMTNGRIFEGRAMLLVSQS
jgi:hypothetical protein